MRDNQKKVAIGALALVAIILVTVFLHFGSSDYMAGAGYPFLTFAGDDGLYSGVFANAGEPMEEALALGIIVPILLLAAGGYILVGMKKTTAN